MREGILSDEDVFITRAPEDHKEDLRVPSRDAAEDSGGDHFVLTDRVHLTHPHPLPLSPEHHKERQWALLILNDLTLNKEVSRTLGEASNTHDVIEADEAETAETIACEAWEVEQVE
jgi:hypothetical protein